MKTLTKILMGALVAFAFTGNAWALTPNSSGVYELQSCNDLIAFADVVNKGAFSAKAKLIASFDCSGDTLVAIGDTTSRSFTGIFDGNGYTIKNLYFGGSKYSSSNRNTVGLFGSLGKDALIKDVFLEGVLIYGRNGGGANAKVYAGGIAGYNNGGTITNCVVKDAIIYAGMSGAGNASHSGGIVGYNASGTVKLCSVGGNSYIEATTDVGGIVGQVAGGLIENCLCESEVMSVAIKADGDAGGIVGNNNGGTVKQCVYVGEFVQPGTTGDAYGGAIVGKGTACSSKCYYTYEGLKVGGNDEYDGDVEDIKNKLGDPWDTMDDGLILNPRDPETGVPTSEMYIDVTFNMSGKGATFTQTAGKNHLVTEPDVGVIDGQGVEGWYRDANFTSDGLWNFVTDSVNVKGIILYAKWSTAYKITFDANGGSWPADSVTEKYMTSGKAITAEGISTPKRKDYKFKGWNTSATATSSGNLGTVSAAKTIYAAWEAMTETITITYSKDALCVVTECLGTIEGGPISAGQKTYGQDFALSTVKYTGAYTGNKTSKKNYVQAGWTLNKDKPRKDFEMGGTYSGDSSITLYPYWVVGESKGPYTISYLPGAGASGSIAGGSKTQFVDYILSTETFTREGYVQDGWAIKNGGVKLYDLGGAYKGDSNQTFYPHWVEQDTVTFKDGSTVLSTVVVTKGNKISKPTNPLKSGYAFVGWYNESTFDTEFTFATNGASTNAINSNTTLYAKWESTSKTITYKKCSADSCATYTTSETKTAGVSYTFKSSITGFTKTGYTLAGWTGTEGGTKVYDLGGTYTKDSNLVLFPVWTATSYSITYNNMTGFDNVTGAPTSYNIETATITLQTPSKTGFTFGGWFTASDLSGTAVTQIAKGSTGNKVFYAKWTINVTVTAYAGSFDNQVHNITVSAPTGTTIEYSDTQSGTYSSTYTGKSAIGNYTVYYKVSKASCVTTTGSSTINIAPVVTVTLPTGASLVCSDGATGAANCNTAKTGVVHKYGTATTLPDAAMDGWEFDGWYNDNTSFSGTAVTSIPANQTAAVSLYPKFTKTVSATVGDRTFTGIEIDNNDTQDSINAKIAAVIAEATPAVETPTKDSSDKYTYTFKEYNCTGSGTALTCEALFDSTGRVFDVAVNLPTGASLVCTDGADGAENCNTAGNGIVHQFGTATTPIPAAEMDGWTFKGWFNDDSSFTAPAVTAIGADKYGDDINIYPKFTKTIQAKIGDDVLDVEIDNNDTQDSIDAKVSKVAAEQEPPIVPDDTLINNRPEIYHFSGYKCELDEDAYVCEAKYDTTGFVYDVTMNLPEGASLVCDEGETGAENCNATKDAIKHEYGVETTPLPNAAMTGWTFAGWFSDDSTFAEPAVTSIPKNDTTFSVYPKFTKELTITLSTTPLVEVTIVVDNNDDADSVSKKVNDAYALLEPKPTDPTKESTATNSYEFSGYACEASGATYTCEAQFEETGLTFPVAVNLPDGTKLVCDEGATGAENCNAAKNGIKHQFGTETKPLPNAVVVDANDEVDDSWTFHGWFDNADGLGETVVSIDKNASGNDINIFPYFTKDLEIVLSEDPEVKVNITIDKNDTEDSVGTKVDAAVAALDPAVDTPTKDSSDKYTYTFKGYECEASGETFACKAAFDSTARKFEVAVNLPKGASLVCEGDAAENCTANKDGIKHTYGTETTPIPAAEMDGWTFKGWFNDDSTFTAPALTAIDAEKYGDDINIYPKFTKTIQAKIGDEVLEVEIDNNDTQDSIDAKVSEAAKNHEPAEIKPTPDTYEKKPYIYTFAGYECDLVDDIYTCEAVFDSVGMKFDVAITLPTGASLVCTEGAFGAENCNAAGDAFEHQFGVETKPLPNAEMDGWEFAGWFDNENGIGDGVESIPADVTGEDLNIFPYFTKVIKAVIGEDTIDVVIDYNDTQDSIDMKVSEAAKKHEPVIEPTPTHIDATPKSIDFAGYECDFADGIYTCEAVFDTTGITYKVATNLSNDMKLVCEGEAAAACNEKGDGIEHTYGTETKPLPDVVMVDKGGKADTSWKFEGWFDNENGIGDAIASIDAESFGDTAIYPYLTKTIQVNIDGELVDVVIDNNDTQDSINAKAEKAAAEREQPIPTPTKDKDDNYEYEFAGYDCDETYTCEAVFDSVLYGVEVVAKYGDDPADTILVMIQSGDDEAAVEEKVTAAFKNHEPALPIPTKEETPMYTFEFEKFAYNPDTDCYEPSFKAIPKTYKITFNMPDAAKLVSEIEGNTFGEQTMLPDAVIKGSEWKFKGWYTEPNGKGTRVKVIAAADLGEKEYYALFQKTITYDVSGEKGNLEVVYDADTTKMIETALSSVIPEDFEEKGKTYTFSKWNLTKGVYTAIFTDITSIAQARVPYFSVIAIDRTLEITGARKGAKIAVFDLGGRLVTSGTIENATQLVPLSQPGSYIVRVNNQTRRVNIR